MSVKVHNVLVKKCNLCGEVKPLADFGKISNNKDGLDYSCRLCANRRRVELRKGIHHPRISSTKEGYRICTSCKTEKPLGDFAKSRNRLFGVHSTCKECMNTKRRGESAYKINARKAYHKRRMTALLTLRDSAECFHCFTSDLRLLSIDHIQDNGSEERRKLKRAEIFRKIIKMGREEASKEYQILCRNCNWLKRLEMGDVKHYEF